MVGRPLSQAQRRRRDQGVRQRLCTSRIAPSSTTVPAHGSTVVCPYHRWAYRLDGSLIGAPLSEGVDLDGVCLPTRAARRCGKGSYSSNLSGFGARPARRLAGLSAAIAPWRWCGDGDGGVRAFESTWNWKIMVENWIECYHHIGAHRDSVEPFQPARTTRVSPAAARRGRAMTVDTLDGVEGPARRVDAWRRADAPRDLSVWAAFPLLLGGSVAAVRVLAAGRADRRRPSRRDLAPRGPPDTARTLRRRTRRPS